MTTIVEKPCAEWIPVGWEESAKACEMVHYHPRLGERNPCDEEVAVAFRFTCCGNLMTVCDHHWSMLSGGYLTVDPSIRRAIGCPCGRRFRDFQQACAMHWRI